MGEYTFHILGCRGSRPMSGACYQQFGGATSCYLLRSDWHAVVLDCGTGLYNAGQYLRGCRQIDVLLTHLHYDHILGLLNWSVFPPDADVRFYISGETAESLKISEFLKKPFWPVSPDLGKITFVDYSSTLQLTEDISARFFPANHPDNASLIRVDTENGAVCLVGDWEHGVTFPAEMAQDCSLLVYDGMFTEEEYPYHKGWGHSTWQEGVKLAEQMQIPNLIITHHLPERSDEELLDMEKEASQGFPGIRFAREGDVYTLHKE